MPPVARALGSQFRRGLAPPVMMTTFPSTWPMASSVCLVRASLAVSVNRCHPASRGYTIFAHCSSHRRTSFEAFRLLFSPEDFFRRLPKVQEHPAVWQAHPESPRRELTGTWVPPRRKPVQMWQAGRTCCGARDASKGGLGRLIVTEKRAADDTARHSIRNRGRANAFCGKIAAPVTASDYACG
jgi:hypothetical protein